MRITIIRDDGLVGIGGTFRMVDLSTLPPGIRAVQWDGKRGHVEHDESANTKLDNVEDFQPFIELWKAAAPQPALPVATGSKYTGSKQDALARIDAAYRLATDALKAGYPDDETRSWPLQETEARAWLQNPDAATPWLDAAANARSLSKAELAGRIVANAASFASAHGQLTGKRQKLRDQIAALGDNAPEEQLDAIQWE
jgi:hypothetical protein